MSRKRGAGSSPVSHSCISRMPGVSIRMPWPGSMTSCRLVLVCRPRLSEIANVAGRQQVVADQAVDDRATSPRRTIRGAHRFGRARGASRNGSSDAGLVAGHGVDRDSGRDAAAPRRRRRPGSSTRSALFSTMTGVAPLSAGDEQVALDAPRVEVAVEPGDEEHDVDVGGDDLLLGAVAGGAAREAARPRQHRPDPRDTRRPAAARRRPSRRPRERRPRRRHGGAAGPTRGPATRPPRSSTR